jgi:transposase
MNQFTNTIGIDVSKDTLDAYNYKLEKHHTFKNQLEGFRKLIQWSENCHDHQITSTLFCFEHTGVYSLALSVFMEENNFYYKLLTGLEVRRAAGLARGKSDKEDARKIAAYGYWKREILQPTKMASKYIMQLKELLNIRERMVKHRGAYQNHLKGLARFYEPEKYPILYQRQEKLIQELTESIKLVEKDIIQLIEEEPSIKQNYDLATSTRGIGLILGLSLLVYSDNFTKFKTWRHFASYAGTAPFDYQSGSSIKRRKKVSHIANKRLKALLSNAALSSIRHSPEMRLYYEKRVKEGKNKMLVQNIIRNKLLSRVFAVVRRSKPYVDVLGYAA